MSTVKKGQLIGKVAIVIALLTYAMAVTFGSTAGANLAGSTFEGNDGNLTVDTIGMQDWVNAPNRTVACDLAAKLANANADCFTALGQTAPSSDNSFKQGTSENDVNVTVASGSIPPQKSDLTRFYTGSEFAAGSNYLYLGWERSNTLGTATMDFEINQNATAGLTNTFAGAITLNRTAGDLLVTYQFSGSGSPTITLYTWGTTGCGSTQTACWGNAKTLGAGVAEAAINGATVSDPVLPSDTVSLPQDTFGEASVNLTAAGVFPPGTCKAFGSARLSTRSSATFTDELKDFIAPVPVNVSNCGTVKIIKHTDPRGLNQSFSYTSTIPNPTALAPTVPTCTSDSTPSTFNLNDSGNSTSDSSANTETCTNVPAGAYTVTEGAAPANFTLESLTCTASGTGSSGKQDALNKAQADITVGPDGLVTCTYQNKGSGAIKVTKTGKNVAAGPGDHPLALATFSVNGVSKQTDSNGNACFDGLTVGQSYTVTETAAPTGYSIDTAQKSVTVTAVANCTAGTPNGVSFTDSPLTDLTVHAKPEVTGATSSSITCKDATPANIGNSPQTASDVTVTANGLKPGTYTCTVVVDP